MKGKKEIIVATVLVAMVLVTLFFYLMGTREIEYHQIVLVGIAIVLVALAMYVIWEKNKECTKRITRKR
jgi:chromate transport protein ChrA